MALQRTNFGVGLGLVDKSDLTANFTAISAGSSTTVANGLTATAGGGQANGFPMTAFVNRFTTVATAGDSADLPLASGQRILVINATANSMNVFAMVGSSDTINQVAGSTAYALAAGKIVEFVSAGPGVWNALLSA